VRPLLQVVGEAITAAGHSPGEAKVRPDSPGDEYTELKLELPLLFSRQLAEQGLLVFVPKPKPVASKLVEKAKGLGSTKVGLK
jgi:hypothetical protein